MSTGRRQYPFDVIEPKWQRRWDEQQTFRAWNPGETIPETHPFALALDFERSDNELVLGRPYFETVEPRTTVESVSYVAGEGTIGHPTRHEWNHGMGEIVSALLDAGLRLTMLREHPVGTWPFGPPLVKGDDGWWRHPGGPEMVPLMYTLQAVKGG